MAAATPLIIPEKSQDALISLHKQCYSMLNQQWNVREMMRQIDLAYIREADWTNEHRRAQLANRYGDSTKFQNVTVPVVMPQVETAVDYQSSVFLTGYPLFGWTAPPDQEDTALQYQAIIEENSIRGGWVNQFMLMFTDAFKYNLCAVEVDWGRKVTAALDTDLAFTGGKEGKPKEVIWSGNTVTRWDLYNTFYDSRCLPTEISEHGEFAGRTELMSRIRLKKFISELPDKIVQNITKAFESGLGTASMGPGGIESYYVPQINPDALITKDPKRSTDWMAWAGMLDNSPKIQYKNLYEVTTMYARILPSDFKLNVPAANTPQVWKFIIVNHQVLIYAERCTNAHNRIPVLFGQPNEDGLGYQTKSLASNAKPFQEISSALVNSAMAARRRAISDRVLFDPSRVSEAHINSPNPSAKIPVRPAAYGKPIQEAVYPFPFRDDQSAVAFQELPQMLQMANTLNGQNAAKQGQFVKGNKTLHEYSDVMARANGRDQRIAMRFEGQIFTPLKEIIKLNTLQYQGSTEIYSVAQQQIIKIDPVALRKSAATFKISDGLVPTDKVISSDEFAVALQTMGSAPQIAAGYNITTAFSYLMKTRNVDLKPFEKSQAQLAYEQALASWQQMATLSMEKLGKEYTQPQPKPQDYGYNPGTPTNSPQSQVASSSPQSSQPQQPQGAQ